ncbi:MAG: hypothetical protein AABZ47_17925 [Planctomycetota bacterium]
MQHVQSWLDLPVAIGAEYLVRIGIGNYNVDGLLKLPDLMDWLNRLAGPCISDSCQPPRYRVPCRKWIDFDADEDVDLRDFSIFQSESDG